MKTLLTLAPLGKPALAGFVALSLLFTASPLIAVDATVAATGNKLEITKVGALGDDKTLNTTAIQAAIDQLVLDRRAQSGVRDEPPTLRRVAG